LPGGSTTLFDYYWDGDDCHWMPWTDKVPEYVHVPDRKFHKILVPTVDTVRTTWLLSLQVFRRFGQRGVTTFCWKTWISQGIQRRPGINRAAVGIGIPTGMGMAWVWRL